MAYYRPGSPLAVKSLTVETLTNQTFTFPGTALDTVGIIANSSCPDVPLPVGLALGGETVSCPTDAPMQFIYGTPAVEYQPTRVTVDRVTANDLIDGLRAGGMRVGKVLRAAIHAVFDTVDDDDEEDDDDE